MIEVLENFDKNTSDLSGLNLNKLAEFVLKNEDAPENSCASLNFISKDKIHKLNRDYRGINKPTDVLSFECDGVKDAFNADEQFEFGDIFICYEVALSNAKKFNTTIEDELKLLTVHGMLHLCGYDHIEDDQAIVMENREEELLSLWENKIEVNKQQTV